MTAPLIYDVTTDSFRPVTQAEVNAMIARLNGNSPVPIFTQFAAGAPFAAAAVWAEAESMPPLNVWSADATMAAR